MDGISGLCCHTFYLGNTAWRQQKPCLYVLYALNGVNRPLGSELESHQQDYSCLPWAA